MAYSPLSPKLIHGYSMWQRRSGGCVAYPGPHVRGQERYVVEFVPTSEAAGDLRVYRSPDQGLSWEAQDVDNMPEVFNTGVTSQFIAPSTLRICYASSEGEDPRGLSTVRNFDCATGTLGPVDFDLRDYAASNPLAAGYLWNGVVSEDWVFVHEYPWPFFRGIGVALYRHGSGGFLPPIVVSDNVADPDNKICYYEGIYQDPSGTVHVLYSERPRLAPMKPRKIYYRQIAPDGTMSEPQLVYTYNFFSQQTFGWPDVLGSKLYWPFPKENGTGEADQYWTGAALVIDPYTSPTPAISVIDLPTERLNLASTCWSGSIHARALGSQIYFWWLEEQTLDGSTLLSRILYSAYNGSGAVPAGSIWHDEIAEPSLDPPERAMMHLSPPVMDGADPMLLVALTGFMGGFAVGPASFYWATAAGPPAAPAPQPVSGSPPVRILIPNRFDYCLCEEAEATRQALPSRDCFQPLLFRNLGWIRAPSWATEFSKSGVVPTPLAASGDVEVLSFRVPEGYDGVLAAIAAIYTGPVFDEGNGDLEWRLRINRVYATNMGRVLFSLGDVRRPMVLDGGIPIQSGQRISLLVSAPNLSGVILPLATRIIGRLEGVFYARS